MVPWAFNSPYPWVYTIFFLYLEPASILVGAYYAHFAPKTYLEIVHATSALLSSPGTSHVARGTQVLLSQLANVYVLFALNEALVLRSTSSLSVWKTMLSVLLVADFGHMYIVTNLGTDVCWNFRELNAADWAKPVVAATIRIAFLLGIGIRTAGTKRRQGSVYKK